MLAIVDDRLTRATCTLQPEKAPQTAGVEPVLPDAPS